MTLGNKILYFLFVVGFIGLVLWLFFIKGCGHPAPAVSQSNPKADSALALVKFKDSLIYALEWDKSVLEMDTEATNHQLAQWQQKVAAANKQVTGLANDVVNARTANDTTAYTTGCDSLAAVTLQNQHDNDSLKRVTRSALDARDDLAKNRAQLIGQLQAQAQGFQSAVAALQKQIKDYVPAAPRVKGYGGIDAMVAPGIFGIGVGGMIQDKASVLYRGSVGICTTSGLYVGVGYYRLIKL